MSCRQCAAVVVAHLAHHGIDAKRCSLFIFSFSTLNSSFFPFHADNVLWWLWHNWGPSANEMATLLMMLAGNTFELALKLQR